MDKANKNDSINHPSHYTQGNIEVIDFIEDQRMGYCLGNAIKYLCRYRFKDTALDDLKKAQWYMNRLIKEEEYGLINVRKLGEGE